METFASNTLSRNWWAVALRGVVAILFGIIALASPGIGLAFLVALFGAFALVDGIFSLVSGIRAAKQHERWGSLVLVGITGIAAGLIAWFAPGITAMTLLFLIAAWAVVTGVMEIVAAVKLRKVIHNEWLLGIGGALSVLFGILLFANPGAGALAVVWLIGIYAILFGAMMLGLGFRLRSYQAHRREVEVHA